MPGRPVITDYGYPITIWALLSPGDARTVLIESDNVPLVDGKRIVKAGTILGSVTPGETIFMNNAHAKAVNDATAEGVLVNDVDVTHGDVEGAMAFTGSINVNRMPVAPTQAAKDAMRKLTFMNV